MSVINVLLLIGQLHRAGAERQCVELAKGLDRSRYRCTVCTLCDEIPLADELCQAGIEVVVLDKKLPFDVTRLPRLVGLMREERIDVLHSFLITGNSWGRVAALFAKPPVVIASVRTAMPYQPRAWTWANRALARYTDALVVNTLATREYLVERREMAPERIEVIYNGIDVSRFDVAVDVRAKRTELGLRPDCPVVGIVGRFVAQKDHAGFVRAAKLVSESNSDAQFLCVGRGPTLETTEALAHELGIADKVVFAGERPDIPEIMHALDVLVLPSRWEGFPNVLMEAMATSCPVIATRVGGSPELVVDGETGLLVPPGQPQALASALLRVLDDGDLATTLGQGGRHRVESLFSRERMVGETAKLYERLLQEKGGR